MKSRSLAKVLALVALATAFDTALADSRIDNTVLCDLCADNEARFTAWAVLWRESCTGTVTLLRYETGGRSTTYSCSDNGDDVVVEPTDNLVGQAWDLLVDSYVIPLARGKIEFEGIETVDANAPPGWAVRPEEPCAGCIGIRNLRDDASTQPFSWPAPLSHYRVVVEHNGHFIQSAWDVARNDSHQRAISDWWGQTNDAWMGILADMSLAEDLVHIATALAEKHLAQMDLRVRFTFEDLSTAEFEKHFVAGMEQPEWVYLHKTSQTAAGQLIPETSSDLPGRDWEFPSYFDWEEFRDYTVNHIGGVVWTNVEWQCASDVTVCHERVQDNDTVVECNTMRSCR